MPSFIGTPLQLLITGSEPEFQPRLSSATALNIKLGFPNNTVGPGSPQISDVTTPTLDRLNRQTQYVNPDGTVTMQFQLLWQRFAEAIEAAFGGLTGQVGDLTTLVQQIQAAQALAQAANDNAVSAKSQQDITNSYTNPTSVLTASSDGTISIAAHSRVYGDGRSVPVNAGSLSGFAPGDYVSVFYDDSARAGGAVSYQGTTNAIAQSGDRHSVGQIAIPQAGSPPATGGGVTAPGYVPNDKRTEYTEGPDA